MKNIFFFLGLFIPLLADAQQYSLDWFKVAGGGASSSGGIYQVSGTVGQPDASGPLNSGSYSLSGGFWTVNAVQVPGAPLLTIKLTATNTAQVYWPSPSIGFNLQVSTNITSGFWTSPSESVQDNGTVKFIIVHPAGFRFYRLKNP